MPKRLYRVLLLAVVAWILVALASQAHTTIAAPPDTRFAFQQWVDEAKVPTPDLTATVHEMATTDPAWPCHTTYGYEPNGCIVTEKADIYLDTGRLLSIRDTLWHELGHLFDYVALTDADRAWFASFIRWPAEPWLSAATHETAGELFAETYAICAHYGGRYPTVGVISRLVIPPEQLIGNRRFNRLCTFIRNASWR